MKCMKTRIACRLDRCFARIRFAMDSRRRYSDDEDEPPSAPEAHPPTRYDDSRYAADADASDARYEDEEGGEVGEDGDMGDDEELYAQAIDVLKSSKRASTSMLQRRLRIGYNRAARIMDLMEEKGVVGPENGSSPREILVDLDTL